VCAILTRCKAQLRTILSEKLRKIGTWHLGKLPGRQFQVAERDLQNRNLFISDTWRRANLAEDSRSFQVSAHQIDQIFGQFRGDFFLGAVGEVKTNMGFQILAHEAVYASANGSEEHQLVAAIVLGKEGALDGIELAAEFADALQELQFFPFVVGHGRSPMNSV